jgi:hypothetical protein
VVLALVAAGLALWLRDPLYALVIVWALVGILVNRLEFTAIVVACGLAAAACVAWLVAGGWRKLMPGQGAAAG